MILDTCALLWLAAGGGRLSSRAVKAIENAPNVCISAITGFEIALQHSHGRLKLAVHPKVWVESMLEQHGIACIQLSLEVCANAAMLPHHHRDPCDRFIIATAKLLGMPVVTTDRIFEKYGVETIG